MVVQMIQEIPLQEIVYDRKKDLVGIGTLGKVFKAKYQSKNLTVAVKELKMAGLEEEDQKRILSEIKSLAAHRHENIVSLFGYFYDADRKKYGIVSEFQCGKDLDVFLAENGKKLNDCAKWNIFKQIISAVESLHSQGFVHRELKTNNFMISENDMKVKLRDFGTVKNTISKLKKSIAGKYFWAPELLKMQDKEGYSTKSDIFALGYVLYELFSTEVPFKAKTEEQMLNATLNGEKPTLELIHNKLLRQIVSLCLENDPEKRPTSQYLLQIIKENDSSMSTSTAPDQSFFEIEALKREIAELKNKMKQETQNWASQCENQRKTLTQQFENQTKELHWRIADYQTWFADSLQQNLKISDKSYELECKLMKSETQNNEFKQKIANFEKEIQKLEKEKQSISNELSELKNNQSSKLA